MYENVIIENNTMYMIDEECMKCKRENAVKKEHGDIYPKKKQDKKNSSKSVSR